MANINQKNTGDGLFSFSGGIVYHWRALMARLPGKSKLAWDAHRASVQVFLEHWGLLALTQLPPLVLVGCSGGYSLPEAWLKEYLAKGGKIIAVEPDALARKIFTFRMGFKPEFITSAIDFENLKPFLSQIPKESAILFCNVMGQITVQSESKLMSELQMLCSGRRWASYHDVISGEGIRIDVPDAFKNTEVSKQALSDLKQWVHFEDDESDQDDIRELNLHLAYDFFPASLGHHFHYWEWKLTGHQTQLIEGVYAL